MQGTREVGSRHGQDPRQGLEQLPPNRHGKGQPEQQHRHCRRNRKFPPPANDIDASPGHRQRHHDQHRILPPAADIRIAREGAERSAMEHAERQVTKIGEQPDFTKRADQQADQQPDDDANSEVSQHRLGIAGGVRLVRSYYQFAQEPIRILDGRPLQRELATSGILLDQLQTELVVLEQALTER